MAQPNTIIFLLLVIIKSCLALFSFHENTHIIFQPEFKAEYFGYSTLLTSNWMLVGAPKARNTDNATLHTGAVFNCTFGSLSLRKVTCYAIEFPLPSLLPDHGIYRDWYRPPVFSKDDMWFGSNMAMMPKDKLFITAPRWSSPFGNKHLLMNGMGLFWTPYRGSTVYYPLQKFSNQAYVTNGSRREYGEYGTNLNFYAYGQSGFSLAVTKRNTVILGAPGLLQWTGGIVTYSFNPNDSRSALKSLPTPNLYLTKEVGPDDYFGYSVASGIFDKNGEVLYVAGAPRANLGQGQVFIFEPPRQELEPLSIKAKLKGEQHGASFGASLCALDINGDGYDDLLVGAPTFVKNDGSLPYDQGAVFVYMTKQTDKGFVLEESGRVVGSEAVGAWFGISICDLGDVDGDGFRDIAIGAPRENDGIGAVYIYKGSHKGLRTNNVQRIQPKDAKGFGWSVSSGVDVDENNCNDLAVGAIDSETAYIYRSIPTMFVEASIKVPDALNLPQNSTNFTAMFCVDAPPMDQWPHVEINLIAEIEMDKESNRVMLSGESTYNVRIAPGHEVCDQQIIEVNPIADLSKPISLTFQLQPDEFMKENSNTFLMNAARLSEDSVLQSSFLLQLVRDCGEDLVCTPWLVMTLEALDNPYIPGSNDTLGARITVLNIAEPAYAVSINITLPMTPKRLPSECSLQELVMFCELTAPILRNEKVTWDIELEYNLNITEDVTLNVVAELNDPLYRNISEESVKELSIDVTPEADFSISGKSIPNITIPVSRKNLDDGKNITFKHYFEITNLGPSDWPALIVHIVLADQVNVSGQIEGCEDMVHYYRCTWTIPAMVSYPVSIPLFMDLDKHREFLQMNTTFNATSNVIIQGQTGKKYSTPNFHIKTTLKLEPESHIWWIVAPCVIVGLVILAFIVRWLHSRGFFSRPTHKMLQREKETEQNLISDSETSTNNDVLNLDDDLTDED